MERPTGGDHYNYIFITISITVDKNRRFPRGVEYLYPIKNKP